MTPGQTLGRYELLMPIAQGGMAAVWAARRRGVHGFSKTVAIKTMLPEISEDPQFERMFLDEARVASRIIHPNVVQILDLGEQDDVLFLVMEWVDGESLATFRRMVPDQRMPLPVALQIVIDVCAGLHAAHTLCDEENKPLGLVHRDVSPQNILIGYDGVVRITDFGVAKVAGRTGETTSLGRTRGKPPYMSPEQARGRPIDCRADVFALGIVLYQLTTGRHPFRGETDVATLHNILGDQPLVLPSLFVPSIPSSLETVISRALCREPGSRTGSARELMLALEEVMEEGGWKVRREDVARLMGELCGAEGEATRQALREALRRVEMENRDFEPSSVGAIPVARNGAGSTTGTDGRREVSAGAVELPASRASSKRRWLVPGLVALAGLASAVAVGVGQSARPTEQGARASVPSVALPAPSQPAVASVTAVSAVASVTAVSAVASVNAKAPVVSLAPEPSAPVRRKPTKRRAAVAVNTSAPAAPSSTFARPPLSNPGF